MGRTGDYRGMSHSDRLKGISVRPDVFGGKPIVRAMRLSVELIPGPAGAESHTGRGPGRLAEAGG